jgi:hypothetical protein
VANFDRFCILKDAILEILISLCYKIKDCLAEFIVSLILSQLYHTSELISFYQTLEKPRSLILFIFKVDKPNPWLDKVFIKLK